ncbi:trifunctional transcriptional activator/DNA repair protein Ada/methylated-DNA--[protein]-cysteine S-methyltransferase [Paenibacillus qinlingensis]|uniref:AraC family transcriptional regulator of adaptative response/methylated-DNA-[protein]-cysteine methyltransferase n=1 Tax=Paenibacillus qinlingensis TaxID=1837343 RepID=A0ABU1NZ59_9BACL|nr:trifunctional transcriptional activator/DNA repair protein Ada/methylated-DNA--[protein]-cysteine S-methyltransferase [Paenibacillus qinlingensis]MDR6552366.1 AraC family transcriptional regulator of adaptative response/methylated-DNA-[protein]-cysteine methyltransferase [Paenibacillus qinlingensis]
MIDNQERKAEYYKALVEKKSEYEGVFYVGVTSTGVFCRPTCPARKPKYTNCEFYETAQQALLASFRPCQRCRPLSHPNQVSDIVRFLVEAVEQNPEKRWKGHDFRALSIDESTARRQFKKRFGMTFVEYARSRRMGLALKSIRSGEKIINTQLASGYDSSSGFRDAFSRIMGAPPTRLDDSRILKAAWLDTMLGPMVAIADESELYLLEFVDRRGLESEVARLRKRMKAAIIPGQTVAIQSIERELTQYFEGTLTEWKTPLHPIGSPFQQSVWDQLRQIPPGETRSYADIALALGKPTAYRAVAQANGANQLAIVIPCHRVINSSGALGGYGGGSARKEWFLNHEKRGVSNK